MEAFKKVVRIGTRTEVGSVFCKIEFANGRLSISGVEGPKSNGNCRGGCGQIDMHLRDQPAESWAFAPGWNAELLAKFWDAWERWHLNDMKPCDEEMEAAGWPDLAKREVLVWKFNLTTEALAEKSAAEKAATEALRTGATFTPTEAQTAAAVRPYTVTMARYEAEGEPAPPPGYRRAMSIHRSGYMEPPERKTLGWMRPDEHPDGLLGRKLRPDGPGYGTQWWKREVPPEVLAFLRALPDTDTRPAWV